MGRVVEALLCSTFFEGRATGAGAEERGAEGRGSGGKRVRGCSRKFAISSKKNECSHLGRAYTRNGVIRGAARCLIPRALVAEPRNDATRLGPVPCFLIKRCKNSSAKYFHAELELYLFPRGSSVF